jgi:hypothetical protein
MVPESVEMLPRLPPAGWCAALTARHPLLGPVFAAFGAPLDASVPAHPAVEGWLQATEPHLGPAIEATLTGEVDAGQAAMFARRIASVGTLIQRIHQPALHQALVARAVELLHAPAPRALRIRALADFYYSHAARLHHQAHTPARPLREVVETARWHTVSPGLEHALLTGPGPAGPLHVNVLRCTNLSVSCALLARDPRPLHIIAAERGALAAVSGGFFLYSEPDIPPPLKRRDPVGLLVADGEVRSGPGLRRATLWLDDHGLHIDRAGPVGWTLRAGDHTVRIEACNTPQHSGPTWFNRAWGTTAPAEGLRVRGSTARGPGRQIDLLGGVLVEPNHRLAGWTGPISWEAPGPWTQAMAGGPMLVGPGPALDLAHEDFARDAPPITFSRDETYDENLLPRMAAGLDPSGRLYFAAIDGRNFDRAPGFTLRMTAELMRALGCDRAMNLDGGSSKRMAVGGRCVDLASTEVVAGSTAPAEKVRAVVSAVFLGG